MKSIQLSNSMGPALDDKFYISIVISDKCKACSNYKLSVDCESSQRVRYCTEFRVYNRHFIRLDFSAVTTLLFVVTTCSEIFLLQPTSRPGRLIGTMSDPCPGGCGFDTRLWRNFLSGDFSPLTYDAL